MENRYEWLEGYLLSKPGAQKDYKAEWEWWRFRVHEKMFAAICKPGPKFPAYGERTIISLKCDTQLAELFRAQYEDVIPGFYMDKANWNSVFLDGGVPDDVLRGMCDMAYSLVFNKLTKKAQKEILEGQAEVDNNIGGSRAAPAIKG